MPKKNELEQNPQPVNNNVPEKEAKQQLLESIAREIGSKNLAIKKKESGTTRKINKTDRKAAANAVKKSDSFKTLEAMSLEGLRNLWAMSREDLYAYWQGIKEDTKAEKERLGIDKDTQKLVEDLKKENDEIQKQIEQGKKPQPEVKEEPKPEVKKEPQKQNIGIPQVNSKEELETLRKSLTEDNVKNPDHVVQNRKLFLQVSGEFNKAHPQEKKKTPKIEKKPKKELSPEVKAKREEERKNRKAAIQNQRDWDAQIHEEDEKQQQQNLEYIQQMQSQWDAEDRGMPQQEKKNPGNVVMNEEQREKLNTALDKVILNTPEYLNMTRGGYDHEPEGDVELNLAAHNMNRKDREDAFAGMAPSQWGKAGKPYYERFQKQLAEGTFDSVGLTREERELLSGMKETDLVAQIRGHQQKNIKNYEAKLKERSKERAKITQKERQEKERLGEDEDTKKLVEKLQQEELAQIGEDDATKNEVQKFKPENDEAQKQLEQEKKPQPEVKEELKPEIKEEPQPQPEEIEEQSSLGNPYGGPEQNEPENIEVQQNEPIQQNEEQLNEVQQTEVQQNEPKDADEMLLQQGFENPYGPLSGPPISLEEMEKIGEQQPEIQQSEPENVNEVKQPVEEENPQTEVKEEPTPQSVVKEEPQKQITQKKGPEPTVKQEPVKKEEPQEPARTYAIPLTPEHVMQATADMEPLMGKLPKLNNVNENAVRGGLYNIAIAAAVGKDAIGSLDMNEPGAKEDLSKSLADVMTMQIIQTGIESNDPDFKKALDTPGGLQKMEKALKENQIFRDMVNKPDTPEAAMALADNSTRPEKYRFARNAALMSMKPEKVQEVSEPAADKTQESLQNEEKEKAKIDKLFGEGAYEESKKVQAEKAKFEKVFGEGTFIPYKEEQAQKQKEQEAADAKPVDAMPFANALEEAVLGYHGSALGTGKLQDTVANFLRQHRLLSTDNKATKLSLSAGDLKKSFQGFAQEADALLKKVGKEPNIPHGFLSSVEMAQDVQVLNQMAQRGIDPGSLEGKKMMLAAKIAFGGGRSFTDGKDFLCNSEKFMKTVDLVMKTRSFQNFTKGKSPEEIGKMATFSTEALYQDFNARLMDGKEKKLETGQKELPTEQKNLETTVGQKKPQQIAGKKKNQIEEVGNMLSEFGGVSKEQGMTMAKQLKELMQGGGTSEEIMKKMINKNPEFKTALKNQIKNAKEKKQQTPKKLTQKPLNKEKKKEVSVGM